MQPSEHSCQGNSSKQHLYDLEKSQSSHQSHHYEALDLCLQNEEKNKKVIQQVATREGRYASPIAEFTSMQTM